MDNLKGIFGFEIDNKKGVEGGHEQELVSSKAISQETTDDARNVLFRKGKSSKDLPEDFEDDGLGLVEEGQERSSQISETSDRPFVGTPHQGTLTGMAASINLANSIIGSGVLGLSYVGSQSGILTYVAFQICAACLAIFTCMILVRCTEKGGSTLESIGEMAFGTRGVKLCAASVCMQGMGSMLSYITIIGDVFPQLIARWEGTEHLLVEERASKIKIPCMLFVTVFIILPFTFAPRLDMLKYSSFFGVIVFLVFTVTSFGLWCTTPVAEDAGPVRFIIFGTSMLSNLPATLFATNSHHVVLTIYHELKDQSPQNMLYVVMRGYALVVSIYMVVAISGYCLYRSNTKSDLIDNFPESGMVEVLRTAMLFAIVMGFPNIHWAVRRSVLSCIFGPRFRFEWKTHIGSACAICATALTLGIIVPDLSVVLKFVGATASAWLIMGLPSVLALKLGIGKKITAYSLMAVGAFIMVSGISFSIRDLVQPTGEQQQWAPMDNYQMEDPSNETM